MTEQFHKAVIEGLSGEQKEIPCKYLYDARGSKLFDDICGLEEYYPTRTEMALLEDLAGDLGALVPEGAHLVEFGSGSSVKIRLLLDSIDNLGSYVPVDISREHLMASAEDLASEYREIKVVPVCADFTRKFDLPPEVPDRPRVGFFPGSTIGNFTPEEAAAFLHWKAELLGKGGGLIIGVDLKKDPDILHAAYNDREGVTADFNLNLLTRINRELGGDFEIAHFHHEARYEAEKGRVEMHIVSDRDQTVSIGPHAFAFAKDESIHTENSYKYGLEEFRALAESAGFRTVGAWTDGEGLFSLHYLEAA